jgi:hypothetical protein
MQNLKNYKLTKKTRLIAFLTILFTTLIIPSYADVNKTNTINVVRAKELAINYSRALKSLELSVEETDIYKNKAKDANNSLNAYRKVNELRNLMFTLEEKMSDPNISTEEKEQIQQEISGLEITISGTKALLNPEDKEQLEDALREAENANDDMIRLKNDTEKIIAYNVEQLYANILKMENELELVNKTYELNNTLLNVEKLKDNLGMSTPEDVKKVAITVSDNYKSIKYLKEQIELLRWQLNDLIGFEHNAELELVPFNVSISYDNINYDKLLTKLKDNYSVLIQKERNLKDRKDDLNDDDLDQDEYEYDLVQVDIKKKQLDLEDEKMKLKTTVKNLIADLEAKKKKYQLSQIKMQNSYKTYEWDKTKFNLGMISAIQLKTSEISYLKAKNENLKAAYDYLDAKRKIELAEQGILISNSSI